MIVRVGKPCLISLVRSWALWDVYLSKTSNTPSRAIPRDILKREVKDYVSNCESLLRYLKLESVSFETELHLMALYALSLPRQHPVGKQNRQAIVKDCEVVEEFDLPALE
jgi:hypothetical protein